MQIIVEIWKMGWRTLSGEPLQNELNDEVRKALVREKYNRIKVCIGSDSQVKGEITEFATAIVFLREGKGGFVFVNHYRNKHPYSLKERMIQEVSDSIQTAYSICPLLDEFEVELEIHADINTDPNFKSNVAFKEAMGYILGMGYTFKAKPDAFASSYCADRIVS